MGVELMETLARFCLEKPTNQTPPAAVGISRSAVKPDSTRSPGGFSSFYESISGIAVVALTLREKSTCDRIRSELNEITDNFLSGNMPRDQMSDQLRKYDAAIIANVNLRNVIAESRGIDPLSVLTIAEGNVFYDTNYKTNLSVN
jgi:hypothetical protein